jgi:hypothetical protein
MLVRKCLILMIILTCIGSSISRSVANIQLTKEQRNVDKETRREERDLEKEARREEKDLEKEAKKVCEISYEPRNGKKKKKCEPSIYDQALPGINFEETNDQVFDDMIRELQKDVKSQNNVIVR